MSLMGLIVLGVMLGMLRFADFGMDPYNVLMLGLSGVTNIDYPIVFGGFAMLLLIIVAIFEKKYIGLATVLNFLFCGYMVDWAFKLFAASLEPSVALRIVALVIGIIGVCISVSLIITSNLGLSTYDAMGMIMANRTPLSFRVSRIITDFTCVVGGFFLGASVGITTLVAALCLGPVINWSNEHISRPLLKLAGGKGANLQ